MSSMLPSEKQGLLQAGSGHFTAGATFWAVSQAKAEVGAAQVEVGAAQAKPGAKPKLQQLQAARRRMLKILRRALFPPTPWIWSKISCLDLSAVGARPLKAATWSSALKISAAAWLMAHARTLGCFLFRTRNGRVFCARTGLLTLHACGNRWSVHWAWGLAAGMVFALSLRCRRRR